jgi:hypothetical protein
MKYLRPTLTRFMPALWQACAALISGPYLTSWERANFALAASATTASSSAVFLRLPFSASSSTADSALPCAPSSAAEDADAADECSKDVVPSELELVLELVLALALELVLVLVLILVLVLVLVLVLLLLVLVLGLGLVLLVLAD